jgi:hypothetical protein
MRTQEKVERTMFNCSGIDATVTVSCRYQICLDGMHEIKRFPTHGEEGGQLA